MEGGSRIARALTFVGSHSFDDDKKNCERAFGEGGSCVSLRLGHRFLSIIALSAISILTGCASVDEGAFDYKLEHRAGHSAAPLVLKTKYSEIEDPRAIIEKGDTITIDLKQVFVKHFTERFAFTDFGETQGEIAVVANVYEMSNEDGRNRIDFGPESVSAGRVIFYSPDVREGQFLNFSQMPMFGPFEYQGNRLVIQIFLVEIDANSDQVAKLLGTLAKIGGAAYPPASPVLEVLQSLGSTLIKGNQNDIDFAYSMTLLPDLGSGLAEPWGADSRELCLWASAGAEVGVPMEHTVL